MAYHSASYRSSAVTGNVLHYALAIQLNRFRMTLRSAAGVRPCTGRTPAVFFSVLLTLRLLCCMACCQYGHFSACKLIAAPDQHEPLTCIWRSTASNATGVRRTAGFQATVVYGARISRSTELMHVILIITHVATWPTRLLTPCTTTLQHRSRFSRPQRVSAMPCDTGMPARFKPQRPEARCTALLWMAGHALGIRLARHNTPAPTRFMSSLQAANLPSYHMIPLFTLKLPHIFPPCHSLACTFLKFDVAISVFRGTICVLLTLILFCGAYRRTIPGGYHEREHPRTCSARVRRA